MHLLPEERCRILPPFGPIQGNPILENLKHVENTLGRPFVRGRGLGWAVGGKLEESLSLGSLTATLQSAMEAGSVRPHPVEPLAHLILGSVMEAALLIANSENATVRRREVGLALDDLLCGLETGDKSSPS